MGYLQSETHTVPLLQGLGYLETFYRLIEKRNEPELTHSLGVRWWAHRLYHIYVNVSMKLSWYEMLSLFVLCCRCTSCNFSVPSLTSRHGTTAARCRSDGSGQRSSLSLVTWITLPVWRRHVRASKTGFNPMEHSSLSKFHFNTHHYQSATADIIHINSNSLFYTGPCHLMFHHAPNMSVSPVFTPAYPLTWQRQCIQLELRMTTAGAHSYTHTTSPSLQHKKAKSCLPWPAAETPANCKGIVSSYYIFSCHLVARMGYGTQYCWQHIF